MIQHQAIGLLEVLLMGQLDVPAQYLPNADQLRPLVGIIAGTGLVSVRAI